MMDPPLRKRIFKIISEKLMANEWKFLGRFLDLEEEDIDAIYTDCRSKCGGIRDCYYEMLVEWFRRYPTKVTVRNVLIALGDLNRKDICQLVENVVAEYYGKNQHHFEPSAPDYNTPCAHQSSNTSVNIRNRAPSSSESVPSTTETQQPKQQLISNEESNVTTNRPQGYLRLLPTYLFRMFTKMTKLKVLVLLVMTALVFVVCGKSGFMEYFDGISEGIRYYCSPRRIGYFIGRWIF